VGNPCTSRLHFTCIMQGYGDTCKPQVKSGDYGPSIRLLNNSISSYKGQSSGADAKSEQPVCE
jgi:hypothetical protein